jgi:hypothetical protein
MATREELLADPAGSNAAVEAVVKAAQTKERPIVADAPADLIQLPGGLIKNGEVIRSVRVRELTGRHEEALARALTPPAGQDQTNWAHFMSVLLECGTEQVGEVTDEAKVKELLKDMLTGDRDAIVL